VHRIQKALSPQVKCSGREVKHSSPPCVEEFIGLYLIASSRPQGVGLNQPHRLHFQQTAPNCQYIQPKTACHWDRPNDYCKISSYSVTTLQLLMRQPETFRKMQPENKFLHDHGLCPVLGVKRDVRPKISDNETRPSVFLLVSPINSLVGRVTRSLAGLRRNRSLNAGKSTKLFSSPNRPHRLWCSLGFLFSEHRGALSPEGKVAATRSRRLASI
jgi:hypothetical protein